MDNSKNNQSIVSVTAKTGDINSNGKQITVNPVYPVVPVDIAMNSTRMWRKFNEEIQQEFGLPISYLDEYIRAFFIPASDILAIAEMIKADDQITGCRAYIGIEDPGPSNSPVGSDLKLFLVGVQGLNPPGAPGSGIDLVRAPDSDKSLIYDFTCPCPSTCDVDSVLYKDNGSSGN